MRHPICISVLLLLTTALAAGDSLAFFAPPYQVDEGGSVDVLVIRTGSGSGAVGATVTASGGMSGAALGLDFTAATPSSLSWADGDLGYRVVHVPVLHNPAFAPWHNLALALGAPTGGAAIDPDMGLIHIPIVETDVNPAGTLSALVPLPSQAVSVRDDAGSVTMQVARLGGTAGAVTATCYLVDGGAVDGVDYQTPADPTLTWADGEGGTKAIQIPLLVRSVATGPRVFYINMYPSAGGASLGTSGAVVTITDHLAAVAGTASCTTSVNVPETAGHALVAVHRSGGSSGAVSLDYQVCASTAVDGVNLDSASGTLTWADGDTADKTIAVAVHPDGVTAPTLYGYIVYSNPVGGLILPQSLSTSIAITDADGTAGLVGFTTDQLGIREDAGPAVVHVARTGGSHGAISVDWSSADGSAVDGVHYTGGGSGTLTWADGDTADKILTFPLIHDGQMGPTRAFYLTLSNPAGGTAIDTGSWPDASMMDVVIADADVHAGTIAWSALAVPVHESAGGVVLTATRTGGSVGPVSVPLFLSGMSAFAGTDFGAPNVTILTWADGDSADKTVTIPIVHDGQPGADRTFSVAISPAPSGGADIAVPNAAIVTILEDDQVLVTAGGGAASAGTPADGGGGGCGAGVAGLLLGFSVVGLRRRLR